MAERVGGLVIGDLNPADLAAAAQELRALGPG
jgi:hypothetical protein